MKTKLILTLLISVGIFYSCEKDKQSALSIESKTGYYVLNEGAWGNSNASIGFLPDGEEYMDELFYSVNERPLGDVLMCMSMNESSNTAYLVLNSSNKIEIIDADNFQQKGVIEGLESPRDMVINDNKGYVSQWGAEGCIKVVDLTINSIINTIPVGVGPEGMLIVNNNLWVANSGGYGTDNEVSVINLNTLQVSNTISVGDNPVDFVLDKNDDVWVLCAGYTEYDPVDYSIISQTPSQLVNISTQSFNVQKTLTISDSSHPLHLAINPDGSIIYFGGGFGFNGIFAQDITSNGISGAPLIDGYFYSIAANQFTGDIIGTQAPTFTEPGSLSIYDDNGSLILNQVVGIGPNGVIYKSE